MIAELLLSFKIRDRVLWMAMSEFWRKTWKQHIYMRTENIAQILVNAHQSPKYPYPIENTN